MRVLVAGVLALIVFAGLQLVFFEVILWMGMYNYQLSPAFIAQMLGPYTPVLAAALLCGYVARGAGGVALFAAPFAAVLAGSIAFEILLPVWQAHSPELQGTGGLAARALGAAIPAALLAQYMRKQAPTGGDGPLAISVLAPMVFVIMLMSIVRLVADELEDAGLLAQHAVFEGLTRPLLPALAGGLLAGWFSRAGVWWTAMLAVAAGYFIEYHLHYQTLPQPYLSLSIASLLGWCAGAGMIAAVAAGAMQRLRT